MPNPALPITISIRAITTEQTYPLRHAVLWPDKPPAYVKVENDADGYHFGAFHEDRLVAVISLFVEDNQGITGNAMSGEARFRKFATHPDFQKRGVGTRLLNYVIAEARQRRAATLWCDARLDAADFYRRFGMEPVSEVFYKGSIPYARFSLQL